MESIWTISVIAIILLTSTIAANPAYAMIILTDQYDGIQYEGMITMETEWGTLVAAPLYTDFDDPAGAIEPPGGDNDGVGKFLFGGFICTAVLLADSTVVPLALTAGHCVTDDFGVINLPAGSTITFEGTGSPQTIGIIEGWTQVPAAWDGDFLRGNDIALIELESFPTADIDRYFIDRSLAGDIGLMPEQVGYGLSGTGALGVFIAPGTKHLVFNTYDDDTDDFDTAMGKTVGVDTVAGARLIQDFDSGLAANDANGFFLSLVDPTGKGVDEGMTAGGDSGGPHFNSAKEITAITSYGATIPCPIAAQPSCAGFTDVDELLNSSFGEWGVDTRVASYTVFIDDAIANAENAKTPVGGTMIPIDQSALLLAGVQSISMWMIPVVIAGIGIGIFVIKRRN